MSNNPFRNPSGLPHIRLNPALEDANNSFAAGGSRSLTPQLHNPYGASFPQESSEHLLDPSRAAEIRYRDHSPGPLSPTHSTFSSRRSSWASERSRDSRGFENPFKDSDNSRRGSVAGSEEDLNTQTVSEKYNIHPTPGLLLYPEDVENDDYLHNPDPGGEPRDCNICTKRGFVNIGGLTLIAMGILALFVGYPALTFVRKVIGDPDPCKGNSNCIPGVGKVPLLQNVRMSLIDPDTPKSVYTKTDFHGNTWNLVFSDEFSKPGRTFFEGDDPYFTAVDLWYGVTMDLEWYDPDAATTNDGVLEIRFDAFQNHNLNYRSAMLQTWNQMCFKGGRLEASISLPGRGDTVGFWPGFWTLGNLGRAGYAGTTEGMWPYSYSDVCDAGITPNQSSPDGISWLPGMKLPACTCLGEDHPTPGKSRSAPEIDVIEATVAALDTLGNKIGEASQSFQVAPYDIWYQPDYNFIEVYDNSITSMNIYKGGPYQEAISGITNLNHQWYDGNAYQVYAFEYTPGAGGDISWFIGDHATWRVTGSSIGPNGNIGQRVIPEEPMSMILNFGMSSGFSDLNMTGIAPLLPAKMRVDYIRVYQDSNGVISCDPPGYETTEYIKTHQNVYTNPNITTWTDSGKTWPKNTLMNGCKS